MQESNVRLKVQIQEAKTMCKVQQSNCATGMAMSLRMTVSELQPKAWVSQRL